ncbi:hypothetical protein DRE_00866 [Drechslerella stenobrocha 248]|uniref:Rhodopsin domain-containing protein n=1 Tax=Drechslerella stenobrocha 248 TaxID=1043628 RepID=W7HZ59_9PEZI|nr:hypothetical protein DRE_00866 [Drechslerella stenobrocha 248]
MAAVVILGVAYGLLVIFYCVPVRAYWDPYSYPDATCLSDEAAFISNAAVNIVLDCWLWVMPVPIVWSLRLPMRQRIGLVGVFGLGFFVCLAGILRLVYVIKTAYSYDRTWDGFSAWIWTAAESDVGIICASLPALKPLVTKVTNYRFSEAATGAGRYGYRSRSRTVKRPGNKKHGKRLPSRSATRNLGSRNPLQTGENVWDGSDEAVCACERGPNGTVNIRLNKQDGHPPGMYQMTTVIFSGDPDGRLAEARKNHIQFIERGKLAKDGVYVQARPVDGEGVELGGAYGNRSRNDLEAGPGAACGSPRNDEGGNCGQEDSDGAKDWKFCWEVMRTIEIEVHEDHSFEETREEPRLSTDSFSRHGDGVDEV